MEGGKKKISPIYAQLDFYYSFNDLKDSIKKLKFKKTAVKYDYVEYRKSYIKKSYKKLRKYEIAEFFFPYVKMTPIPFPKTQTSGLPEANYDGDIYILTDRYSASASEYTIALLHEMTKNTDIKIHHLGENSCGAAFYVDPCNMFLPNSGVWFYLPTTKNTSEAFNHPDFHGEGYGWFPEYWTTHYNLLNTLTNLIDDPELENALQGLEKWQLQ